MVLDFYTQLREELQKSERAVLMVVISSKGSSPGRSGFKMWVSGQKMGGTIGGGIMEHKLVEYARKLLDKEGWSPFVKKQQHSKEGGKDQSGMICSGEQYIAFYRLETMDLELLDKLSESEFITFTQEGIKLDGTAKIGEPRELLDEKEWRLTQSLQSLNKLFIIGGGHVGRALSEVLHRLDFEVHMLDHRAGLNTMENNQFVETQQIVDFEEIELYVPEGGQNYVVIMSFGYRTDEIILRRLMHRDYRYIGMMGSQKKVDMMFEKLKSEGVDQAILDRIHAPIGIDIKSESSYEIAISVAAQLIEVKNREKK